MSDLVINLVSSEDDGVKSTRVVNLCSSDSDKNIPHKSLGNDKHKKFLQKRQFLERRGLLKDKQNKFKHKKGRPLPALEGHSHQGQPPWQNGAMRPPPPPPSAAKNPNPFHTHRLGSATSSHSQASASTNSPASLTVSVMNTGNPEQSQKTMKFNSTKTTASFARGSGGPIGNPAKYLAIDCEMVGTGPKGRVSQLARCSIVSYEGDVVYDKFIKPPVPVTDFRTRWSGIRYRDLAKATPYPDARKEILRLITGKVVIGHAIHNDFKALGYFHPPALTRDTSRIPLLNQKAGFADKEVASLKRLTKAIFNRDIQVGKKGHSSVEDAKATMELYKVVEVEWERKLVSAS